MKRPGLSRTELIMTVSGLVVLAGLLMYAVADTRRRSRDTERLSTLRQLEFDLRSYRNRHASYPESIEAMYQGAGVPGFTYTAEPLGCLPDGASLCSSYGIAFALEGRVGTLSGGDCESSPEGITCIRQ